MRRVVVTGIGVVSPLGIGVEAFWSNLLAGQSGIRRIEAFDPSGFAAQLGAEVPAFKIAQEVPKSYRKATKVMARDIELAILAAKDAFASAGLKSKADVSEDDEGPDFDPRRFGCNIGAGLLSAELNELTYAFDAARKAEGSNEIDWAAWGERGMQQLTPLWMLKYLPNMLACHVTIVHGLTGPSNNITCAEASGHLSIGEAFRTIQRGNADLAIAGGAESKMNPMSLMRQQLLKRLTTENDRPADAVRPFAEDAGGTVIGEGGALLILEEHDRARERGATIYAEVAGFGASQDIYDPALPDPEGQSYAAACRGALREAGAVPGDVSVVVPHGLGIRHHDQSELAGLKNVFGQDLGRPAICPIKGQIGCLAAGCAIEAATAAMIAHTGKLPPAKNASSPELNLSAEARETERGVILAPIFGLGGQNAALALRKV